MFSIVSSQIVKMFLLIIVGFICCRTGIVDKNGNKTLSNLLLMVINPVVIIDAFQIEYSPHLLQGVLLSLLLGFLSHFIGIGLAHILIPEKNNRDYNVERFSCVYSNCGFMGIPLIGGILGSEGILYITSYIIAFNVMSWTQGLVLMTGNSSWKQLRKGLTSPVIICIIIGLFLFINQIRLPALLGDTLGYLAGMNTPVGMLVAGVSLAQTSLVNAVKNPRLYLITAVRLLVIPMIMLALFCFLPLDSTVRLTILIASACPVATTCTMFALRFDKNYQYASEIFAFSTLVSMATIPGIVLLAEHFMPGV